MHVLKPFFSAPFQEGDQGVLALEGSEVEFDIVDSVKAYEGGHVLCVRPNSEAENGQDIWNGLEVGAVLEARVDSQSRARTAAHHTSTHLLHAALSTVLDGETAIEGKGGGVVSQAGSVVDSKRLRSAARPRECLEHKTHHALLAFQV